MTLGILVQKRFQCGGQEDRGEGNGAQISGQVCGLRVCMWLKVRAKFLAGNLRLVLAMVWM